MVLDERFKKALEKKARRGFSGYPIATVAVYGANEQVATKASVAIIAAENQALERWYSEKGTSGAIMRFSSRFCSSSGAAARSRSP